MTYLLFFLLAPEDKCLLLFAAWNASGKLYGTENIGWDEPSKLKNSSKLSAPKTLFRIRNEVCDLFFEFGGLSSSMNDDTLLLKRIKTKRGQGVPSNSASIRSLKLRGALSANLDDVKEFTARIKRAKNINPSSGEFAVFESTIINTSFLISLFTTSENDFHSVIASKDKINEVYNI